ncbi:tetratricopeptide repeat protein [Leptospira perolatii]|uniref:Tetratricopeptide repeat protein n=1 Tax=Leptospira perolatii TaxID=2023191 RepID=A0ABX4PAJ4_9LEPT|nr:tetratricopeptide repeat protein [Leptospira perolatii]PJZ70112.1 hypothetical protein CH360_07775 [Leptospira perolatii]
MAEPSPPEYSSKELEQIQSILNPLSTNPESSDTLNPMLPVFREKLGYTMPISIGDEEEAPEGAEEEDFEEEAPLEKPKPKVIPEDDDIDLDELLAEPRPAETEEAPFAEKEATPPMGDFDFGTPEPEPAEATEEDAFAGMGEETAEPAPTGGGFEDFDFGTSEPSEPSTEDPFAGMGEETAEPAPTGGGFEDFDLGTPSATEADPFASFGSPEEAPPSEDLGDMFGSEPSPSGEPDFGDLDFETGPPSAPSKSFEEEETFAASPPAGGDPFADFAPVSGGQDPFAELSSATPVTETDPFADFSSEPAGVSDMDLGEGVPESSDFTSFSPDLESESDMGGEDLGGGSFEADLRSLGGEEKDEIDKALTDEELAIIQREILKYPPLLRRAVIESIVQDRLTKKGQRDLLELIKVESAPEDVAAFLSSALGTTIAISDQTGRYSKDGVPILSTDPIYTKEGLLERRRRLQRTFIGAAAIFLFTVGGFLFYEKWYKPHQAARYYDEGLEYIRELGAKKFEGVLTEKDRNLLLATIEEKFARGEEILPHNLKYLNLYGVEYSRAAEYEKSFEKLFGRIEPDLGFGSSLDSWTKRESVPLVRLPQGESWSDKKLILLSDRNQGVEGIKVLVDQEKNPRKVVSAGAYLVMRLRERIHDNRTYRSLGWFHSQIVPEFAEPSEGKQARYKNDSLAIDYYRKVFTDGESPYDEKATAGIAKIYYNRREFGKAASFYNRIVEINPGSILGQSGLISTYIEMWKESGDPQFVLNHHRLLNSNLDMESDLPFYTLSKLASFYSDIDPEDVRIRFNINPTDQVSGIEIEENALRLLDTIYRKSETDSMTGREVEGREYAEGYYQRGHYYLGLKENSQARRFFEKAATLDKKHWLAVLELAEHSIRVGNFEEARDLLKEAESRYQKSLRWFGSKDEDETLFEGNPARIYFDQGKIRYLLSAGLTDKESIKEFPGRKIYPFRARGGVEDGKSLSALKEEETNRNRRNELRNSLAEFKKVDAEESNYKLIRDWRRPLPNSLLREMKFYRGWVEYMDSNFETALGDWTGFEDRDEYYNETLLMGKGNAFFYTKQVKTALGYFLRVKDDLEEKLPDMGQPKPDDPYHQEVYQTLTAAYNNIGAAYEVLAKKASPQQAENYTAEALKHYWKAIETARKIGDTSEIPLSNKDLLFKRESLKQDPLLEDWVSPTLDSIKDMIRK